MYPKKHREKNDYLSIRIHINKIENRIIFKRKGGYYLKFLIPEVMKLLEALKRKIVKAFLISKSLK